MATTAASQPALPNLDHLTPDALKALILTQQEQLRAQQERLLSGEAEIDHLRLLLTQLRRLRFGRKSEKLELRIEQLELKLEEIGSAQGGTGCERGEQDSAASWPKFFCEIQAGPPASARASAA